MNRREFLFKSGAGFGALALNGLLQQDRAFASANMTAKQPHFPPRAKSVIFLFMEGGPSHLDLFDPKPLLNRLAGQRAPSNIRRVITSMGEFESPLLGSNGAGGNMASAGPGFPTGCPTRPHVSMISR